MSEQITAEIVTEEPAVAPEPATAPIEEPSTPLPEAEPELTPTPPSDPTPPSEPAPPEVSAAVMQSPNGIWGVQIFTRHPFALDVAVNGRQVWRGVA